MYVKCVYVFGVCVCGGVVVKGSCVWQFHSGYQERVSGPEKRRGLESNDSSEAKGMDWFCGTRL